MQAGRKAGVLQFPQFHALQKKTPERVVVRSSSRPQQKVTAFRWGRPRPSLASALRRQTVARPSPRSSGPADLQPQVLMSTVAQATQNRNLPWRTGGYPHIERARLKTRCVSRDVSLQHEGAGSLPERNRRVSAVPVCNYASACEPAAKTPLHPIRLATWEMRRG